MTCIVAMKDLKTGKTYIGSDTLVSAKTTTFGSKIFTKDGFYFGFAGARAHFDLAKEILGKMDFSNLSFYDITQKIANILTAYKILDCEIILCNKHEITIISTQKDNDNVICNVIPGQNTRVNKGYAKKGIEVLVGGGMTNYNFVSAAIYCLPLMNYKKLIKKCLETVEAHKPDQVGGNFEIFECK